MDDKKIKQFDVNGTEYYAPLKILVTERMYISYDAEKLKEKLDKELYLEMVDKSYAINDIEGLKKVLQASGVKPSEFKPFLVVKDEPNRKKISELFSMGEISLKQLKGCYTAKMTKSIQVK